MHIVLVFKKILKILLSKKKITLPKKKRLFIYDANTYKTGYKNFLTTDETFVFDVRYESIYIILYFKAILIKLFFFSNQKIIQLYTIEVIKVVDPQFLICFSHYNFAFWELKKHFEKKIFIMCQHTIALGYDGKYHPNPILLANKKFKEKKKIDHIFLWGESMVDGYKECIDGKFYTCGSIKNNFNKNKIINNEKDLVFISQYFDREDHIKIPIEDGTYISRYEFKLRERKEALKFLYQYCFNNNLNLVIVPRSFKKKDLNSEKNYYENILNGCQFEFLDRTKEFQIYDYINQYKYYAVIDCSTGYEALARGKKVAHLNIVYDVSRVSGGKNNRYGWPGQFDLKGPFWTNEASKEEIFRCLDFIFKTNERDWHDIKQKYIDPIIIYDEENLNFKNNLKKIGLKLN